jgi:hypothetical protein
LNRSGSNQQRHEQRRTKPVRTEIVCHQLPCQTERNNLELYRWFVPRVITLAIMAFGYPTARGRVD